jgi:hypothetical protein
MKQPIEEVLESSTDSLMSVQGVVGVAQGESNGRPCIKVLVVSMTSEISASIPDEISGYAVVIDLVGEITAL